MADLFLAQGSSGWSFVTLAAVDGLPGPLVVIAGGDGKGQEAKEELGVCHGWRG